MHTQLKGTVSQYKHVFSNGSRIRILIFQSSTWAMWFGDVTITPLARALLAYTRDRVCTLVLASEIDIVMIQKDQLSSLFDV